MIGELRNLDHKVKRGSVEGVKNPELVRVRFLKKSDDMENDGGIRTNRGIMAYREESQILKNYPFKAEIDQDTLSLEFAVGYISACGDVEFGYDFLLYLRNLDKHLNRDVSLKKRDAQIRTNLRYTHRRIAQALPICEIDLKAERGDIGRNSIRAKGGGSWEHRFVN